ncbi:MAG TPA: hypothetical protein VLE43_21190, partial [Candidatus Saccharimonadia bacterium]|nr:hypothetical protein [Candidatus Saccharimonadia bacterium]
VAELAGMKVRINPPYVEVVPLADVASEKYVRQFKLPLAQLLALKDKARAGTGAGPADPFAPAGAKKTEGEVSDLDAFRAQGIPFPEGSMLRYDRDTQTLVVSNTQPNLDLIDTLVNSLKPATDDDYAMLNEPGVEGAAYGVSASSGTYYVDKMSKLIFPSVQFQNTSLEEAIEFLRIKSRDYDSTERDPSQKGVNLIIKPGAESSTAKITLDLKDVPMSEALRYITELGGMKYKVEPYAVVVVPISDVATEMYTRTFKVPPTFLDGYPPDQGPLGRRTAKDVLSSQGIPFPEGASAVFLPSTSQLVVRNTQPSLDLIEGYVDQTINVAPSEQARRTAFNRTKSGLVPLELELPTSGQVITLNGHQRPKEFTLHYLSWERQMARTSLLVLLGATFFWVLRGGRVWLLTFAAVLLLKCVPILLLPTWSAACHALLLGWLMALVLWLLWRMACWWKRRTDASETAQGREVVA